MVVQYVLDMHKICLLMCEQENDLILSNFFLVHSNFFVVFAKVKHMHKSVLVDW